MNSSGLSYSRVFAIDQPEQSGVPDMSPSEVDYFRYRVMLRADSERAPFLNDATKEGELTRFQCDERFNLANDLIGLSYSRGIVK
ncbi:unnamed protein product [Lasius platythorax]|uniref:Uncharacterized protein n=1 Tax=Lasius platythorax TaxID=488582 RepID=A0AAV2P208_9HYME